MSVRDVGLLVSMMGLVLAALACLVDVITKDELAIVTAAIVLGLIVGTLAVCDSRD